MNEKKFYITMDDGSEVTAEILFTFTSEDFGKNYVLYQLPGDEEQVYVSSYTDEGDLYEVESEEELEMINEVLGAFLEDEGAEE